MSSYLVIGSNCFTGSHVVDSLLAEPGNAVIGVSRSPEPKDLFLPYKARQGADFRFVQLDIVKEFDRLTQVIDEVRPEVVIHVAAHSEVALSYERPVEYFDLNTLAVVRLCNYLRTRSFLGHYVHISSAEVFGACDAPRREDDLFDPSTPYAASKAAADLYLNTAIRVQGFPAILVRSTNVYGRHQQLFKIVPRTAIYLRLGRPVELHGGGKAIKSFIHIRDVVDGLRLALRRGEPGTYHFSVPAEDTVADVVRRVCEAAGRDFEASTRTVGERTGQDARYWLDCSKAHETLGWQPLVPFEQGVAEVIEWVDADWATIQHEPLTYVHKASAR